MLTSQRLTIKLSSLRSKLMELAKKDSPTEEDRAAIVQAETDLGNTEIQLRAAIKAEGDATPSDGGENGALAKLVNRANLGNICFAAVEHRATDGAEAELQEHYKLPAHSIPLDLLETRAVATIPADTSHTPAQTSQSAILQPVFATGDSNFLLINQPRVAAGSASFPVLTSSPTVGGPHVDSTSVAETTGAFSAELLTPGRVQSGFSFLRSDSARFPGMEESLRMALSNGLSEALDALMVGQLVSDVARTDSSATESYSSYLSRAVYGLVDGRFVSGESEIRLLIGTDTLVNMSTLYRNASTGEQNAVEKLRQVSAGVRISPHIAAATGTPKVQDMVVRRGARADAVAPLWQGVQLIVDEISGKLTGSISLTAVLLAAFKVIRADAFKRVQARHG